MLTHRLPNTDLEVSALCYGGTSWGSRVRGDDMDRLIDAFRDAGGNFFDTAHCYSFFHPGGTGASELALGDYFRRRGGFGKCVVATKGGHPSVPGYRKVEWYLSPGRVAADIDDSLGRLGVDTIDLYWLHRDDLRVEAGEIIETLNAEVKRGRIRYLAASNWTADRIATANAYAESRGLRGFRGFVASQPEWSLAEPNAAVRPASSLLHFFDAADRAWHERSQIPVVPYTSNAGGYFATAGQSACDGFDNAVSRARLARAEKLAKELACTPGQVALAYLTSHDFPVIPILGTTRVEHLREAFGAVAIKLTREQVAWLRGVESDR